ncbi:MAG: dihydrodipicolinate synthase family protein [Limnohabitans sp.]|nr:dihydrodipicolinate synthase family protein [Limnohabitans sp.]
MAADKNSPPLGFTGAWPALLTPLASDGTIDHARFAQHALRLLANGAGGVTPFGTTGEGPSFSVEERREGLTQLIARGVPAERIIASTSCAAPVDTLALTQHAVDLGVHGCLMLPPFFFKGVSDEGIYQAYREVLAGVRATHWRMYLYHLPQVAGVALPAAVIARLQQAFPHLIAGIKDSGCEREHSVALAQQFMPPLKVYVGHEPDLPTLGRLGSTGAISGVANFMPKTVTRMVCTPDDPRVAEDTHRMDALLTLVKSFALLPALKGVMAWLERDPAWLRVRAPLVALTAQEQAVLDEGLAALSLKLNHD